MRYFALVPPVRVSPTAQRLCGIRTSMERLNRFSELRLLTTKAAFVVYGRRRASSKRVATCRGQASMPSGRDWLGGRDSEPFRRAKHVAMLPDRPADRPHERSWKSERVRLGGRDSNPDNVVQRLGARPHSAICG